MPLSTFNSRKTSENPWGRTWFSVLILFLALVGLWEGFWRLKGFRPSLVDDWDIWAIGRRKISQKETQSVALVGSSRIQLGLHPDMFRKKTGIQPVVLAIDGNSPLPVLAHLAQDVDFKSHVICSIIPMFLAEPMKKDRSEKWIRKYHKQKWSSRVETRLSMLVHRSFVFRNSSLSPERLWADLREGEWPKMPYAPMRPDRFRPADFTRVDVETLRSARTQRAQELHASAEPMSRNRFMERVEHIHRMVKQIEMRGGRIAFVRFPSGGMIRMLEAKTWPRKSYWDIFASRVGTTAIHFEDHPSLSGWNTPDGSHLDVKDARRFTAALVDVLEETGFKPRKLL